MMIDGILCLAEWQAAEVFPQISSTGPAVQRESPPLHFFSFFFVQMIIKHPLNPGNKKLNPIVYFLQRNTQLAHCKYTTGTLYLIVSLLLWINVDIDAKTDTPLTKLTDSTWTAKNTPRETKWQQRQPFLDHMACTRATMLGPSGWFGSKICSGCSPVWHTLWQVHAKSVNAWGSHFSAC